MSKKEDTYSYKGWLNSDRLVKRAFAVMGHNLIAGFFIWLVIFVFAIVIAGTAALFGNH